MEDEDAYPVRLLIDKGEIKVKYNYRKGDKRVSPLVSGLSVPWYLK